MAMLERMNLSGLKDRMYDLKDRVDMNKLKSMGNSALHEAKKFSRHKVRYKGYSVNTLLLSGIAIGLAIGGILLYKNRERLHLAGSSGMEDRDL
jgi:hypothetical protein